MGTPTRILFIAHGHPLLQAGGAEVHAYELYEGFKRRSDFAPVLLARSREPGHPGTPFRAFANDPGQILIYAPNEGNNYFLHSRPDKRNLTPYLHELLRAVRPEVVHFQHTVHIGVDAIRAVRNALPDASIVLTLHEFLYICNEYGQMVRSGTQELCAEASPDRCHECFPDRSAEDFFLRERFIKSHLALVDAFIAPSFSLLERYAAWGLPRERLIYLDYGRQPVPALPPRALADGERRNRFGFFGQLTPFKGVIELLEAVRLLATRGRSDFRLYLNGANLSFWTGSPFAERYRALLEDCGDRVIDLGQYSSEELDRRMALVDWIIVPSIWWENSPLVIQEAFLRRRPVICSDIGGMKEKVVDGVSGLHFAVRSSKDLARALEHALDSDGLWERLSAGIPKIFTTEESVAAHAEIYRALRDRKKPAVSLMQPPAQPETLPLAGRVP